MFLTCVLLSFSPQKSLADSSNDDAGFGSSKQFQSKIKSSRIRILGYLVDYKTKDEAQKCSNPEDFLLSTHEPLNPDVSAWKEFYVYSKGKWYQLDPSGSKLAANLTGLKRRVPPPLVVVKGQLDSNLLIVERIDDVSVQDF